ncbi:putative DNA-binding transcriptional regulator [compost metagenome]
MVFCSPENSLAARTRQLKAADLQGQKWCLQHRFSDTRRQFTLALLQRIPSIDIVLESDSLNILQQAVMCNIGMGCLPRPCIAQALTSGDLVELPIKDLALGFPITVVTRRSVHKTTQHADFVQTVLAH